VDKEHLKKLAENPNFISGIYNYCDRWCDRCPFTSRCMNFALSEEQFNDDEARDINNEAFWQKLSEMFQLTLEMIKETAKEEGIDLESLNLQAATSELSETRDTAVNHECCCTAKAYGKMVKNWFDSAKDLFEKKADDLNLKSRLELPDSNPDEEITDIKDSVNIIRWYQHFIYVKVRRAISGFLRDGSQNQDGIDSDSNGSAKVALTSMDRSIDAWGRMRGHFPDRKDDILDILVRLDRLRRKTETVFPDARGFVRPGLDCIDQSD
jgi:hypothetical protein